MAMSEVNGMNMLEEHDRLSNHRTDEEGMDMAGIHMMEVEDMDMVEEHLSMERSEVDGMNMEGMDMVKDMTVEVVERDHESMVLARHWIGDGLERRW
jgi:hypothetical protein